jgi:hypothetical protein
MPGTKPAGSGPLTVWLVDTVGSWVITRCPTVIENVLVALLPEFLLRVGCRAGGNSKFTSAGYSYLPVPVYRFALGTLGGSSLFNRAVCAVTPPASFCVLSLAEGVGFARNLLAPLNIVIKHYQHVFGT